MGVGDKIGNAGEEAAGKVKEATGKATGNESLEAEGKGDQASANVETGRRERERRRQEGGGLTVPSTRATLA